MKKLTETFNKISVAKGETFKIELYGNPTTGYLWDMSVTAGKATLVKQDSDAPSLVNDRMAIGGGSMQHFIFKAEEAGEIEIKAEYKRPWEKNPAAQSHSFKITVN